ncbi:transport and Golgi organization protein 6 [Anopheles bellator]|uniref:transport and Golgi organization protein 6 n=1 Tax=Anopheles bellator TaxID=139047 RepID=UPI0026475A30|nr:transport and Golgi organization protein 6 [Anopheles bellator]
MDAAELCKVLVNTAALQPKETTLQTLSDCLKPVLGHPLPPAVSSSDVMWQTSYRYLAVLTEFSNTGLIERQEAGPSEREEVINLQNLSHFIATTELVRQFTLHLYLPRELRGLSTCEAQLMAIVDDRECARRLAYCVAQYGQLFQRKMLAYHPRMAECAMDFLAGAYHLDPVASAKTRLDLFPAELVFRCLLTMKGTFGVSPDLSMTLHRDLLQMTGTEGGFASLCRTLLTIGESKEGTPSWRKAEVIAKIVASRGHTKQFYRQVLSDCLAFYRWASNDGTDDARIYAGTCIECLKRFYSLPAAYRELQERIEAHFFGRFDELIIPPELVTGYVLCDRNRLLSTLHDCSMAFSGSSLSSLPSVMLVPYIALFTRLYALLPTSADERNYLQSMTIFCLANRTKDELRHVLIDAISGSTEDKSMKHLHPRIVVKTLEENESNYSLVMGPSRESEGENLLPVLIEMLKSSDRNLLLYDTFLILLKELMIISSSDRSPHDDDSLVDEPEVMIYKRFHRKYAIIQSLMELISHKHFHAQLYDNPSEVIDVLKASISQAIETAQTPQRSDSIEIIVSIFQEFLTRTRHLKEVDRIVCLLQRYRTSGCCSVELAARIELLCSRPTPDDDDGVTPYRNAFSLCSDAEPYCKVYGTTLFLKLLKERDQETVAQRHTVLILALANLRSDESYAFLNSVRLLVGLCDVLEAEVIDALVKEYLNEGNDTDYRLKVGEATVKTVETLGPLTIRYRDALLNCFLTGTRHTLNEFRTSSLANVGAICRILSYQVHTFFYELFMILSAIVQTDQYLPARRAAMLVLAQLIEGMDGLMDFQEYLLLIYRFLKHVIATDKDDITKVQAAVALDHLKSKTKDFLTINPQDLEQRMFGRVI